MQKHWHILRFNREQTGINRSEDVTFWCGGTTPLWLHCWKSKTEDSTRLSHFTVKPKRRHVSAVQGYPAPYRNGVLSLSPAGSVAALRKKAANINESLPCHVTNERVPSGTPKSWHDGNPVRWTGLRKVGPLGLSTLLRFFAPRILERDRSIENRIPCDGFRVQAEIAKALELVAHIRRRFL